MEPGGGWGTVPGTPIVLYRIGPLGASEAAEAFGTRQQGEGEAGVGWRWYRQPRYGRSRRTQALPSVVRGSPGGRAQAKPVLPYRVAETPTEGGYQRKGLKRRWHISIAETSGGFLKSRVTFALTFGAAGQEEVNSVLPVNACGPALPPAVAER